ncbi:MAG: carbamoyltransferase HypF [Gemmatimonadaceae bacterium]
MHSLATVMSRAGGRGPPLNDQTHDRPQVENSLHAQTIRISGVVQGVGFRPFVYRIANAHGIRGWVLNDADGVCIRAEGSEEALAAFNHDLTVAAPPAARINSVAIHCTSAAGHYDFRIAESEKGDNPTAGISPDLAVCDACVAELLNPADRRAGYPYINCTNCGPRFSIILSLPYDRPTTTMGAWTMCSDCAAEYADPANRRFHAEPNACSRCGPGYSLHQDGVPVIADSEAAIGEAVRLLGDGRIVAIKGIGGYHLACDATSSITVAALRERKFRKERPFAVMVRDVAVAREIMELTAEADALLGSTARPIVVASRRVELEGVAPDTAEVGVMLPYTPLHHMLFAQGAPAMLVMTSANRSSEPIAYRDEAALDSLAGIADAFLVGEREISRRVDDSVVRVGGMGPVILRRSRGYAPGVVARIPLEQPTLALGGDLKSTITLVANGDAFVSQHIGDLGHFSAMESFRETVADVTSMYGLDVEALHIVHDMHPEYASTAFALGLRCCSRRAVQHHRAHIASVLAEREAFDERVIGVAFDGTGYGDDGTIWGGEFFAGSIEGGLERIGHLRPARLPGGDAAARFPVQAAAGFLTDLGPEIVGSMSGPPFEFPERFLRATELVQKDVRCFTTTSAGRLFDTVAALLGFTREVTFEGQAAIWLEQLARTAPRAAALPVPFAAGQMDFRPALVAIIDSRRRGYAAADIARAFHHGMARGIGNAVAVLAEEHGASTAVLSGGVFQNDLLLSDVVDDLAERSLGVWTNRIVPPNDGGISLGQAAITLRK